MAKKVLRIINRFNLGGPTFNAAYLTKYLEPEFETLLVGGQWDESEESSQHILTNLGIKPTIIEEMKREVSMSSDREAYKKLKKIIKDFQPDIIHTHASKAGALGRLAAINYGKAKIVHTFHGHVFHSYFGSLKTNIYKNIERGLALKTDKIIAISDRQKLELTKRYNICSPDKVAVIPLGFDLNKFQVDNDEKRMSFRKQYCIQEDEVAVGIIGRLVPIKNHQLFIDAIHEVKKRTNLKVRGFIIGDGEERENLKAYANQIGLPNVNGEFKGDNPSTLHFTSWIKNIDWANSGLDIIALTSFNEGTPVSLIEAQAANKPIISTKVGGIKNTVIQNETAILVNQNDKEDYILNLIKLIENKELRDRLGANGWEHVKSKFHYERLASDMSRLYNELLTNGK
jgi:glycosyltransferase involved in cell wall biosynthesis